MDNFTRANRKPSLTLTGVSESRPMGQDFLGKVQSAADAGAGLDYFALNNAGFVPPTGKLAEPVPPSSQADRREILFVESNVADYQTLLAAAKPGTELHVLDAGGAGDGLAQMAAILAGRSGIAAIHLVSHGGEASLDLGSLDLSADNLAAHAADLASIGRALNPDADILLYGCNVAEGSDGAAFIAALAQATQADIAASDDATGSRALGGDWNLEAAAGSITTPIFADTQALAGYSGLLASGTLTFTSNEPNNFGGTAVDGTGGSMDLPGIVIQIYNISNTGGTNSNDIFWIDPNLLGSATGFSGLTSWNGSYGMEIKSADGSEFQLNQFQWLDQYGTGSSVSVIGYLNGKAVAYSSFMANVYDTVVTVNLAGDFDYVDDVRISSNFYSDGVINNIAIADAVPPAITSASYDAASHVLSVTGTGIGPLDTIDTTKLTLTGEGGNSYTLTSPGVIVNSFTASSALFSITLNAADQLNVEGLLNKAGTSSVGGSVFNLAAAANWDVNKSAPADLSGNAVTVSNVQTPAIASSTYDVATGTLVVTGSHLVKQFGAANDIDVTKLMLTGQNGASYTLTANTGNVEIDSATSFTVILGAGDKQAVDALLNKNGTASIGNTVYNLAVADDWNGPITGGNIADTSNAVTVSGADVPPTLGGSFTTAGSVNDNATFTPFGGVTVADAENNNVSIRISYNAANGTLTGNGLSGSAGNYTLASAALATVQSNLQGLLFHPTANQVAAGATVNTVFTLTPNDGTWDGVSDASTVVTATSINDAPVLDNSQSPVLAGINEDAAGGNNGTSVAAIVGNNAISDVDASATKAMAVSAVDNTHGIWQYQVGAGNWTAFDFGANAGKALLLDVADLIRFVPNADFNGMVGNGITFYAWDKTAGSAGSYLDISANSGGSHTLSVASDTAAISVSPVNDAPVATAGASSAYTENGAAVVIDDTITLSDIDDTQLTGATVTVAAGKTVGDVLAVSSQNGISGSFDGSTGVLTLTGTASIAQYQQALRSVTFASSSDDPTANSASRTIVWAVSDAAATGSNGVQTSAGANSTVNIVAVNDKPAVNAGGVSTYTENGSAAVIDTTITLSDVDDSQISGASVAIVSGFTAGDVLAVAAQNGISGNFDNATGILTLSGTATIAQYQAALRSVTFGSSSDDPTALSASRTIVWTVTDAAATGSNGVMTSEGAASIVNLVAVNDKPVVTAGATSAYTEHGTAAVIANTLTLADADDTQLTGATVSIGNGFTSGDVLAFSNQNGISGSYDEATGVLTLAGTASVAEYQQALRSVTFSSTASDPTASSASRNILWSVTDAGSTGSNGHQTSLEASSTVNITAIGEASLAAPAQTATTANYAGRVVFIDPNPGHTHSVSVSASGTASGVLTPSLSETSGLVDVDWTYSYTKPTGFDKAVATKNDSFAISIDDGQGNLSTQNFGFNISTGNSGANNLAGTAAQDILLGAAGADKLSGDAGNDVLDGGAGNDLLDGGAGADALAGGLGNDSYVVDNSGDSITESAGQGTDAVQSGISYTLGANLENLTLSGSNNIDATGNELANIITGNAQDNVLTGGLGVDKLIGGGGNDTYWVNLTATGKLEDTIVAGTGRDTVKVQASSPVTLAKAATLIAGSNVEALDVSATGQTKLNLTGNSLANTLSGNDADNLINGGTGADTLNGGSGNDTYVIENAGDVVNEGLGAGIDLVQAAVSYALTDNVENLTLTGKSAINGTGNDLANTLTGNGAANLLDGGLGADNLIGGAGNDTYVVDNANDVITEAKTGGSDLVKAVVDYTLGINLENLSLMGSDNLKGSGNGLANILTGNAGNNLLNGGEGNDTLAGGLGADTLTGGSGKDVFDYRGLDNWAANGMDTLSDFGDGGSGNTAVLKSVANLNGLKGDALIFNYNDLSAITGFVAGILVPKAGKFSTLAAGDLSTTRAATASHAQFVYDGATGILSFDADGNGSQAGIAITTVGVTNLAASEIVIAG